MTREIHPLADLFPLLEGKKMEELVKSIKENGQQDPIILDQQGQLIDGRNRLKACQLADVEPRFKTIEFKSELEILAFIKAKNMDRRHLTDKQRADIAAKLVTAKRGGNKRPPTKVKNLLLVDQVEITIEQAAEMMDVSSNQVKYAKARQREESNPKPKPLSEKELFFEENAQFPIEVLNAVWADIEKIPQILTSIKKGHQKVQTWADHFAKQGKTAYIPEPELIFEEPATLAMDHDLGEIEDITPPSRVVPTPTPKVSETAGGKLAPNLHANHDLVRSHKLVDVHTIRFLNALEDIKECLEEVHPSEMLVVSDEQRQTRLIQGVLDVLPGLTNVVTTGGRELKLNPYPTRDEIVKRRPEFRDDVALMLVENATGQKLS